MGAVFLFFKNIVPLRNEKNQIMKQFYFVTSLFVAFAILAGCEKNYGSGSSDSLTIKIGGNSSSISYDPFDLESLSIPVSVVAGKELNQVKVSIIGSDNESYEIETVDQFDPKTQFTKTYKGTDTKISYILMLMSSNGISPKSFLVFASTEEAEESLEAPFKTESSDLIIKIAGGESYVVINMGDINDLSIPVEVISASSPLTNVSVFITGDNRQEYFIDKTSDFENPHYFDKTYIGTQLGAILSNMQQNGVEPESFCVEAATESHEEKNICIPIKMGPLPPFITINSGAEIILDENNLFDFQIPFTVKSESEEMDWMRTFIVDTDGTPYILEEIRAFYAPNTGKYFSKTYTLSDASLFDVLILIFSAEKTPKEFVVQVSTPSYSLTEASMAFNFIPIIPSETPLTDAMAFEWQRTGGVEGTGLAQFGLKWTRNARSISARIEKDNASKLVNLGSDAWRTIFTQEALKEAVDAAADLNEYCNVSVESNAMYNDVIATQVGDTYYMIHVSKGEVFHGEWGTISTITGQYKQ